MDFVEWCERVLEALIDRSRTSTSARSLGVQDLELATALYGEDIAMAPGFHGSKRHEAIHDALQSLEDTHLVAGESSTFWKATDVGEGVLQDKVALWGALCNQDLRPERQELLAVVNRLSPQAAEDYAWVEWVASADMLAELRWSDGMDLLWPVAEELERLHLVRRHAVMGPNVDLHATYRGLVWETRRGWTAEAQEIDRLVEEWETTSVEFKRNIQTNTAGEKAELMKDLLGLANTQASGRRWLILGFDGKTRRYVGSPNAKITQDHLEQLLGEYTRPYLHVAYGVVDYRGSSVGKIEVLRDRRALPYRVKKAVGDDQRGKRIEVDEVFVRRGSQTVRADVDEIAALEAEAAWATGRDRPE